MCKRHQIHSWSEEASPEHHDVTSVGVTGRAPITQSTGSPSSGGSCAMLGWKRWLGSLSSGRGVWICVKKNLYGSYLFHTSVATRQLLPEVGDVVVVLLQILLEVVASESQQGFLHLAVELWTQMAECGECVFLGLSGPYHSILIFPLLISCCWWCFCHLSYSLLEAFRLLVQRAFRTL